MSSKYEFIDGEKANYPVRWMCRWAEVSPSGFYEWSGRPASATTQRRETLAVIVREVFEWSNGTYGYRRVREVLGRRGVEAGSELVRMLMVEMGLVACHPRPWRITTIPGADPGPVDVLKRDFTATMPGVRFVSDITYIPTWEGWLYLATVIDLCTKEVAGWAMADHMRTELVCDALTMANEHGRIGPKATFHSDRGCQYTSSELARHLESLDMIGSMGRVGVCWDNALAESFFASLKKELTHRMVFSTRKKARETVAYYIEVWYNTLRLHSGLGYRTPLEAYEQYQTPEVA